MAVSKGGGGGQGEDYIGGQKKLSKEAKFYPQRKKTTQENPKKKGTVGDGIRTRPGGKGKIRDEGPWAEVNRGRTMFPGPDRRPHNKETNEDWAQKRSSAEEKVKSKFQRREGRAL